SRVVRRCWSSEMRFRFIEDRCADYPVTVLCDVLGVSPAGYYAWRARPESQRAAANRELVDNIKRVHRDTCGRYGSPRIHAELRAQGRGARRGRIERLMRRHGIMALMARPRRVRTTERARRIRLSDLDYISQWSTATTAHGQSVTYVTAMKRNPCVRNGPLDFLAHPTRFERVTFA